jgi:hypothetical protein
MPSLPESEPRQTYTLAASGFTAEEFDAVQADALANDRSASAVLRIAVREYLERKAQPKE